MGASHYRIAILQIASLAREVHKEYPNQVRIACIEDWYVNMRLTIEFFKIKQNKPDKDFTAPLNFHVVITSEQRAFLEDIWDISSSHVNHLGLDRANYASTKNTPFLESELIEASSLILEMSIQFEKYLYGISDPHADAIKLTNDAAKKYLSGQFK